MFENFEVPSHLVPSDPRFGCGPSLVPVSYVEKLAQTGKHLLGTSHRKSAVKNLVKEIRQGLHSYFSLPSDYEVVLGNGGATLFFDMVALGLVDKKITHFTCGEFSEKWHQSSNLVPWIENKKISVPYGEGIVPEDDGWADVLAMTLNETSTGVQLSGIPKADRSRALVAVDATSGAGQVPCDLSQTDVFFFSPQKVFASEGGLWVAIMSPRAIERALRIAKDHKRYIPEVMNFEPAIDNSRKDQTYNTPSISTLFFMNEQLKRMNAQGYKSVVEEAQKKASLLYGWAQEKSYLSCYIKEPRFRSVAVATIDVDDKVNVNDLITKLEKSKLVYGIDAYRKLGRNQFRIALFHNISYDDLKKLTEILSLAIEKEL